MSYRTDRLVAQAAEIRANFWDWHPEADLPHHLMLVAYPDGIWVCEATSNLQKAVKLERIADSWA